MHCKACISSSNALCLCNAWESDRYFRWLFIRKESSQRIWIHLCLLRLTESHSGSSESYLKSCRISLKAAEFFMISCLISRTFSWKSSSSGWSWAFCLANCNLAVSSSFSFSLICILSMCSERSGRSKSWCSCSLICRTSLEMPQNAFVISCTSCL